MKNNLNTTISIDMLTEKNDEIITMPTEVLIFDAKEVAHVNRLLYEVVYNTELTPIERDLNFLTARYAFRSVYKKYFEFMDKYINYNIEPSSFEEIELIQNIYDEVPFRKKSMILKKVYDKEGIVSTDLFSMYNELKNLVEFLIENKDNENTKRATIDDIYDKYREIAYLYYPDLYQSLEKRRKDSQSIR